MGLDPSGRSLEPGMPRYQLTHEDLDDLIAYLKEMESDLDPGLTDSAIRLVRILAPRSQSGAPGTPVRQAPAGPLRGDQCGGGIYGRRIELRFAEAPESPAERVDAARKFIEEERPFALICPYISRVELAVRGPGLAEFGPGRRSLDADARVRAHTGPAGLLPRRRPGRRVARPGRVRRGLGEGPTGGGPLPRGIGRVRGRRGRPRVLCAAGAGVSRGDRGAGRGRLGTAIQRLRAAGVSTVFAVGLGDETSTLLESAERKGGA